ncbi:hypothetical protein [Treponema primitia]|uniref:hypothetical protein n=1 Tax=Treponema primitia TaxID=88058 RepID=UPI000693B856|nr:hypothetical protein [Treponema primitia]
MISHCIVTNYTPPHAFRRNLSLALIALLLVGFGACQYPTGPSGTNGVGITWKGSLASAPENPQTNWAYYNTTDKKSYIYADGAWTIFSQDGSDGVDGKDGDKGDTGATGAKGDTGDAGAPGGNGVGIT